MIKLHTKDWQQQQNKKPRYYRAETTRECGKLAEKSINQNKNSENSFALYMYDLIIMIIIIIKCWHGKLKNAKEKKKRNFHTRLSFSDPKILLM